MRQHNYWKTKKILNLYSKFALYVFGIALLILNLILKGIDVLNFNTVSLAISVITIVISFLWHMFERTWWKKPIFQKFLPDDLKTPVIEGRWEGHLTREGQMHPFVIEIKQTYTSVSCSTYSRHSYSNCICAEILYDPNYKSYQLIYYWNGKTENTGTTNTTSATFYGFTVLKINTAYDELSGNYFTDRQPEQTLGKLYFNARQETLKNSF